MNTQVILDEKTESVLETCTDTGNSGHSPNQDCDIILIYLKEASDDQTKTKNLHSRV